MAPASLIDRSSNQTLKPVWKLALQSLLIKPVTSSVFLSQWCTQGSASQKIVSDRFPQVRVITGRSEWLQVARWHRFLLVANWPGAVSLSIKQLNRPSKKVTTNGLMIIGKRLTSVKRSGFLMRHDVNYKDYLQDTLTSMTTSDELFNFIDAFKLSCAGYLE